jgi:pimeloyl-ACP methyl ester carboxylesterase
MQQRLEEFGGSGEHIIFAHANGYPPGSYRQFIGHLTEHFRVTGFHHRPMWSAEAVPDRLNWRQLANDLIETLQATQREPVWMMGHSMGAAVATKAAATHPELFRGLILIDPIFFSTRRSLAMLLASDRKLARMPMIRKTLNRPNLFRDQAEAFEFHRGKRAFSKFSDEVLWDYIRAGTREAAAGGVELSFPREWEAAAYKAPLWLWRDVFRVRIPVLGLRGETSYTLSPASFTRWQRLQPQAELHECSGGHLLPMEEPANTARYVIDFLHRQSRGPS